MRARRGDPAGGACDDVEETIAALDRGEVRVAEKLDGEWVVNEEAKRAILDYFRLAQMAPIEVGPFEYLDKIPLKNGYSELGVRVVPPAIARYGSFLSRGVVLMPSYVNIGAWVGPRTMVDTWATVGSCAQIGADVHLAGGVGIGGVLEPLKRAPGHRRGRRLHRLALRSSPRACSSASRRCSAQTSSLTASVPIIDVTGPEPVEHRGVRAAARDRRSGHAASASSRRARTAPDALIVGWRAESTRSGASR